MDFRNYDIITTFESDEKGRKIMKKERKLKEDKTAAGKGGSIVYETNDVSNKIKE